MLKLISFPKLTFLSYIKKTAAFDLLFMLAHKMPSNLIIARVDSATF